MEWTGSIRWIHNPVQSMRIWIGLDQKFTNSADSGLDWIQKCTMCITYLETSPQRHATHCSSVHVWSAIRHWTTWADASQGDHSHSCRPGSPATRLGQYHSGDPSQGPPRAAGLAARGHQVFAGNGRPQQSTRRSLLDADAPRHAAEMDVCDRPLWSVRPRSAPASSGRHVRGRYRGVPRRCSGAVSCPGHRRVSRTQHTQIRLGLRDPRLLRQPSRRPRRMQNASLQYVCGDRGRQQRPELNAWGCSWYCGHHHLHRLAGSSPTTGLGSLPSRVARHLRENHLGLLSGPCGRQTQRKSWPSSWERPDNWPHHAGHAGHILDHGRRAAETT